MHLMIAIALGVFGGLWLFTKWGEWRKARAYKRGMKMLYPQVPLTQPRPYAETMAEYEAQAAAYRKEHGLPDPPVYNWRRGHSYANPD